MSLSSVIRYIRAYDSAATDGSGKTALAFGDFTAKYLTQGGTLTSLTTETITTLGTYQAPTDASHVRIKELSSSAPCQGVYEVHFHDSQVAVAGKGLWLFLSATGAAIQPLELDLITTAALPAATAGASGGLLISGSNSGTTTFGALTVSGATTLAALSCTTLTASGAVAFQSTFAVTTSTSLGAFSCTTLTASGAVAFQSTFAVTTSTALAALSCSTLTASGAVAFQSTFATTGTTTLNALTVTNATTLSGAVSLGSTLGVTGAITATSASNDLRINGVVPGAAGGVFIAGTNAATVVTTSLTTTFTGNLTGSVATLTNAPSDSSGVTTLLSRIGGSITISGGKVAATLASTDVTGNVAVDLQTIKTQTVTCSGGVTVPAATLASTTNITAAAGCAVSGLGANVITAASIASDADTEIAAAVWDLATSGHTTSGTFGAAMNTAGSAGDPLSTAVPGAYGAGTAGYLLGTYLDAQVSAVKAKTDHLPSSDIVHTSGKLWVLDGSGNAIAPAATAISTAQWTNTRAGYLDNLSTAPPTVSQIWTTALTEAYAADGAAFTGAQALYEICQGLTEFAISSTTVTVKKRDGSTTAATYTLDSATAPTSRTRAT